MLHAQFLSELKQLQPYRTHEPMSEHTSFRVGGRADVFCEPQDEQTLSALLHLAAQYDVPYLVIGAGSNLLVADSGFRGAVFKLGRAFEMLTVKGTHITAGAGVSLARLANFALDNSLTGLEFASGIPGLLGGAVFMNAGAYGGEMKDVVVATTALDRNGRLGTIRGEEHAFSYRHSIFSENGMVVLRAELSLTPGDPDDIRRTMRDLNGRRREKQPLEYPSAGSTFKRPAGYFAGKLIQDAGLQGYSIGGAQVSQKHAGFIINTGGATASDIYALIRHVQRTVFEKFGVELETEVKLIGEFA